jgi:hypothetical protein
VDQRWIGLGAAALSAALLVVGTFSGQWVTGGYGAAELRIGLRGVEICLTGEGCDVKALADLGGDTGLARPLGLIATAFGLLSALALTLAILDKLSDRGRQWAIAPTTVAIVSCGLTLIIGVVTLVSLQKLSVPGQGGTGVAFIVYGLGAAVGATAAILIGRTPVSDEEQFEPPFERF